MNLNNAIAAIKVQQHNNGFYIRVPAEAAKLSGIKKGDIMLTYLSTDKKTLKFLRIQNADDVIEIPDPVAPRAQPPTPAGPEPEKEWDRRLSTRLKALAERYGLKK